MSYSRKSELQRYANNYFNDPDEKMYGVFEGILYLQPGDDAFITKIRFYKPLGFLAIITIIFGVLVLFFDILSGFTVVGAGITIFGLWIGIASFLKTSLAVPFYCDKCKSSISSYNVSRHCPMCGNTRFYVTWENIKRIGNVLLTSYTNKKLNIIAKKTIFPALFLLLILIVLDLL